jgi:signal peptidase I
MTEKSGNAYKRVLFQGYSMYPSLRPGDVLVLADADAGCVKRGDIVCIPDGPRYIAHRVVDIRYQPPAATLITKGDNLPRPDRPLSLNSGSLLKVAMIVRENGRLIRPRFGRAMALLSRRNLSPGIVRGRIGRIIRGIYSRFHTLVNKEPTRQ